MSERDEQDPVSPHLREFCTEYGDDDVVIFHGFDDCVIGIAEQFSSGPILVYDRDKVLAKLMQEDLSEEDAWEHFYYNIAGTWAGDRTPIFVTSYYDAEEDFS